MTLSLFDHTPAAGSGLGTVVPATVVVPDFTAGREVSLESLREHNVTGEAAKTVAKAAAAAGSVSAMAEGHKLVLTFARLRLWQACLSAAATAAEDDIINGRASTSAIGEKLLRARAGEILGTCATCAGLTHEKGRTMPKAFEFSVRTAVFLQSLAALDGPVAENPDNRMQELLTTLRPTERALRGLLKLGEWSKTLGGCETFQPDASSVRQAIKRCHAAMIADGSILDLSRGLTDKTVTAVLEEMAAERTESAAAADPEAAAAAAAEADAAAAEAVRAQPIDRFCSAVAAAAAACRELLDSGIMASLTPDETARLSEAMATLAGIQPQPQPELPNVPATKPARKRKPATATAAAV